MDVLHTFSNCSLHGKHSTSTSIYSQCETQWNLELMEVNNFFQLGEFVVGIWFRYKWVTISKDVMITNCRRIFDLAGYEWQLSTGYTHLTADYRNFKKWFLSIIAGVKFLGKIKERPKNRQRNRRFFAKNQLSWIGTAIKWINIEVTIVAEY